MTEAVISIHSGRRINLVCALQIKESKRKTPINLQFKFDPGAQNTCVSAAELHITDSEDVFVEKYKPNWKYEGTGIDDRSSIYFYQVIVDSFEVQGVELGKVPIYITFDDRFSKRLLGLDLLNLLNYSVDNDLREMRISQTDRLKDCIDNGLTITTEEMIRMGLYDPRFDLDYMKSI